MLLEEENIHVELTYSHLDVTSIINRVKSPKAGAIVLFAGKHSLSCTTQILLPAFQYAGMTYPQAPLATTSPPNP